MLNQEEVHKKVRSSKITERKEAAELLGRNFAVLPNKKQAWDDLHRLTWDTEFEDVKTYLQRTKERHTPSLRKIRGYPAELLGVPLPNIHDDGLAWTYQHQPTQDTEFKDPNMYLPRRRKLCRHPYRRIYPVRRSATEALGVAFSHIPNKKEAWKDLHRLMAHDEDSGVQWRAIEALGVAFSHTPDKKEAWDDLHRFDGT